MRDAHGSFSFDIWLRETLVVVPEAKVCNLKGWKKGMAVPDWHQRVLEQMQVQIIVFDGDLQNSSSYTSVVQPWLAQEETRKAVAFRKAEDTHNGFVWDWIGDWILSMGFDISMQ